MRRNYMSCPRIFISSTYYDLKHVREIIREFVEDLGYEPVLSEFSDIFYRPGDTVQNSCLNEIPSCDIFVLIVGKRYGSSFPGDTLSITHREYLEAQNQNVPIYAFIDLDVLHDFEFHQNNEPSKDFNYRVVEDVAIFDLIADVQSATKDNSLIPFISISDILGHLKKQWASLLKNLLSAQKLEPPVVSTHTPIHVNFDSFREKVREFGMDDFTQVDVNAADSFTDLMRKKGGAIIDNGSDYKITINGMTTNIGKSVANIFEQELKSIKTS